MPAERLRNRQYAALPYRIGPDGLEILLITSRGSGRWIIPKGWPIAGLTASQSAAREAFEEAGVNGNVSADSIGTYGYDKRLADDANQYCDVEVFALEVVEQRDTWPEQHERRREWLGVDEAIERVSEADVRPLIQKLRERLKS
jgi:8-oxo-dGTP pyrophosphatase MutT (NUDIX family)